MGEQCSTFLICRRLIQLSIFILILLIQPFILMGITFAICSRTVVKYAAEIFRKDLSSMVTSIGNIFAGDNLHESPMSNIVMMSVVEGSLDCENAKEVLISRALEPKVGESRYPELKQYLVKWAGYHFWKTDKSFNLENHFKIIDDANLRTEQDLKSFCTWKLGKKWARNRPLWEFIIIKNYVPSHVSTSDGPHSAIIWLSHHSLADGYSLLYFFTETLGQNKVVIPKPNLFSRGLIQKLTYCILFPLKHLWELSEILMGVAETYWLSAPKGNSKVELVTNVSPIIPVRKVKDVKTHYGTSFAAVQFAALAGALQEYHLKRNIPIQDFYPCTTILPHLGHKLYKFRNYMGLAQAYLPTSESDPYKRLVQSQQDCSRIKQSTFPLASFYATSLFGCNTRMVIKWVNENNYFPVVMTSFPGPLVHGKFLGHKIVDALVWAGPNEGHAGILFALVSYVDGFRISATARSSVMTKDDVSEITNLFVQHLQELHSMAAIDEKKNNYEIA